MLTQWWCPIHKSPASRPTHAQMCAGEFAMGCVRFPLDSMCAVLHLLPFMLCLDPSSVEVIIVRGFTVILPRKPRQLHGTGGPLLLRSRAIGWSCIIRETAEGKGFF